MIDGHVNAVGFLAGPQLQRVVGDGHGGIGGNHEEMIGHDVHAVLDFGDFDLGVLGQQVGEDAVVFGVQMLDENVGHAGVGRKIAEQVGDRFDAAGGGADGHNGEALRVLRLASG